MIEMRLGDLEGLAKHWIGDCQLRGAPGFQGRLDQSADLVLAGICGVLAGDGEQLAPPARGDPRAGEIAGHTKVSVRELD
ncbi:MAG TPA: hypothetical protein VIK04_10105 [Solirubrobacteraceae bacterium]